MKKELVFGNIISNAFTVGLKNFFPLLGAVILWLLTIWIPYLNVGTTIAIATIPALLSRGKMINPTEIFDAKYRKFMGEYFLVSILVALIIYCGFVFLIIPGIVMSIAYSLSAILVIDKGMGATDALKRSNDITYGHKWAIFGAQIVLVLPIPILLSIDATFFLILGVIYTILSTPILLSATGYIYGVLENDIEEKIEEIEEIVVIEKEEIKKTEEEK